MTAIEQENLRVAKHTLAVIAGYGPETGTTLMQLAAREGLRIIEGNEARARMETGVRCEKCNSGSDVYPHISCHRPGCPGANRGVNDER
jgi:hypothetical protein